MIRSNVVLPHPDGPTRTANWPSSIRRLTSSRARDPFGNCLLTPTMLISLIPSLFSDACCQPADEEPLAAQVNEDDRHDRHQCRSKHERLVDGVAALELCKPRHQRQLSLVLEEHQRDQQLSPRPNRIDD